MAAFIVLFVLSAVTAAAQVNTDWIKSTLQDHFSKPRHHVTNPDYKLQAKDFILKEFKSYGLETHVHTFNTLLQSVKGNNIIGILKGQNFKTDKDKVVGLTAHYDTLRDTPGVNANGAAVAVMLQAAKELAKQSRKNTIIFVAFDFLEWEEGVTDIACASLACGSENFLLTWVNQYWQTYPHVAGVFVMDIIMNFNETVGTQAIPSGFDQLFPNEVASINSDGRRGDFIAAIGRPFDSTILEAFVTSYSSLGQPEFEIEKFNAAQLSGPSVSEEEFHQYNDLMRSDHYSFWKRGISAIFLTDSGDYRGYMTQCYHKSCDKIDQVNDNMIKFAGKTTEALIGAIGKLASSSAAAAGSISVAFMAGCLMCVYGVL